MLGVCFQRDGEGQAPQLPCAARKICVLNISELMKVFSEQCDNMPSE